MLFWTGLTVFVSVPVGVTVWFTTLHCLIRWIKLHLMVRILQEKPLFVIPRGQPLPGAEDVRFPTADGLTLAGCYLKTSAPRKGVLLFGLEFGSNRWSCQPYCEHLIEAGYDVFAFESRNQGESDSQSGYEPIQWVTEHEVRDVEAAVAYLKSRPDADPRGVGLFGISKGGGAGLQVAANEPYLRCFVTDGIFAAYTTAVPYMRQWYRIYSAYHKYQDLFPSWFYGYLGLVALRWTEQERGCRFAHLEPALARLGQRPLLMIHGSSDTYIKADMARSLYERVRGPKELWLVEGAKHNQALTLVGDEYRRRVLEFFDAHLGNGTSGGAEEPKPHFKPALEAARQ